MVIGHLGQADTQGAAVLKHFFVSWHQKEKQRYMSLSDQCIEAEDRLSMMRQPIAASLPLISKVMYGDIQSNVY